MILVDGREAATVAATDRGLHYGDGLFETVAVVDGRPLFWEYHLERLFDGCVRLGIPAPEAALLRDELAQVAGGTDRSVVKILLTRGSGGRGYRMPESPQPTRLVAGYPWPEYPASFWSEGVAVRLCRTPLGCNPHLAGLKHLNRLEQVLARAEWDDPEIAEGLMADAAGQLIEGTMSNLFAVRGGKVVTPELSQCGVAGVMRRVVLDYCRELDIPAETGPLDQRAVLEADELFLTNSVIGLWPVRRVEGRGYLPGLLGMRLLARLRLEFEPHA